MSEVWKEIPEYADGAYEMSSLQHVRLKDRERAMKHGDHRTARILQIYAQVRKNRFGQTIHYRQVRLVHKGKSFYKQLSVLTRMTFGEGLK